MNSKYSIIVILIFTILFVKLNKAFSGNLSKNQRLLLRCKRRCANKNNNRYLKRFCKKCLSLDMLDKNKNSENNEISYNNIFSENKNSSLILLSNSTKFDYNKIENLIVFGDSHSAVSTNYTDMTYTGWNHSYGKNWPLHLINFHNMKLWNYAKGGSVIDEKLVITPSYFKIDLKKQCKYFYENMSKRKKFYKEWNKNNSLFAIWIGNIDIYCKKKVPNEIDEITNSLFKSINKLYNVGARNILLLSILNGGCILKRDMNLNNYILKFNDNIVKKSEQFFKEHPNTNIIIYDTFNKLKDIYSNCYKYNFKDCTNFWVKNKQNNLEDYLWSDSHLSDHANRILAEDINNLLNSINN
ncbi:hypothetical protein LY90DRAFT_511706 [Neocallimastix californiae]|uniref:SGNH hydrolase-type esterase domain-containing protein n=1 Tax=Neocallimastix californiae TaxID=1754190 RepID=A0A1Y2BKJ3_9FUNG|nr:hypothetical protein LY90DRAFT_511706 [Neocallimastix californiae]|eukprot:ORY35282.1 hypothetical protein LY90DRAFT_511706 [Neocallimastix californiae]